MTSRNNAKSDLLWSLFALSAEHSRLVVIPFRHLVDFGFGVKERSADRGIRDNTFVPIILQSAAGDVQQTTNFNVVYSAAFGRKVEMTVEPSYRIGQSAGVGLQIRPCTLFD